MLAHETELEQGHWRGTATKKGLRSHRQRKNLRTGRGGFAEHPGGHTLSGREQMVERKIIYRHTHIFKSCKAQPMEIE